MISRTNQLRAALNQELREEAAERGLLEGPEYRVALERDAGDLRVRVGDRLVLRENCSTPRLVNGLIGSVEAISEHGQGLSLRLDAASRGTARVVVPVWYLKAGYAEHAYAITAHAFQGATLEAALVVARPADHSREWTYTAASRARGETWHLVLNDHAVRDDPEHDLTSSAAPSARDERERDLAAMHRLEHALNRTDAERLAQHDVLSREPDQSLERGWDARLEPPAEFGYELGHGPDPHDRDHGRDGPGLER